MTEFCAKNRKRVFVTGMGVISALGTGLPCLKASMEKNIRAIRPLRLFPSPQIEPLPVGEIETDWPNDDAIPRTHSLALISAREALADTQSVPDAVVIGVTTGGMLKTETLLKNERRDPPAFRYHSAGTVGNYVANQIGCHGPVITIATACSSGAAAIKIAMQMLKQGKARTVLAGGADALCRLTYYGFNSLQLVDPQGGRPLDRDRCGMSVGEGAAWLLLTVSDTTPKDAIVEISGGALSCDAYHPTAPHPQGEGAYRAMAAALKNSGLEPEDIDYLNLHGTGTPDNDLAEARALNTLFGKTMPALSSIKGGLGHCLAAAGAIEAVIAAISITQGILPVNRGCVTPDPELNLRPVLKPTKQKVRTVLSNSFGFGGNNAALVISAPGKGKPASASRLASLTIRGYALATGAGDTEATLNCLASGQACAGMADLAEISETLARRAVRRLKRLPRLALSLAVAAWTDAENKGLAEAPSAVFCGTGLGPLSETCNFLTKLYASGERFTSPTDFIGAVHNAPAGQIAMYLNAKGPNVTATGGDYSFEQALMTASLMADECDGSFLLVGADENHPELSPLFDRSVYASDVRADGGGALCLQKNTADGENISIDCVFYENAYNNAGIITKLIHALGGSEIIRQHYGAVLAGIPAAFRDQGKRQLDAFCAHTGFEGAVIDYRRITGEFNSASAVAAVLAVHFTKTGKIPASFYNGKSVALQGKGILVIGLGESVTAVVTRKKLG
ncbi:beta-ketoacyl-[acyl-carrier-protein] synthase family protein [Desulfococcaceae bacterium HSG7]|nr:beta-ketoacyl-[acyl-carrier-protein] synthase family protein [Desulfococcaceae bacterium HSG7]